MDPRIDIVAGIVLYNPDVDIVDRNIDTLRADGASVVLIDNGSTNILDIRQMIANHRGVELVDNGKNLGVAHALNQIAKEAIETHAPFFLTLDQDSIVPKGLLAAYINRLSEDDLKGVAILCPRTRDENSGVLSGLPQDEYVERCITSGSLNRTEAYQSVDGFDDYLFIDEVDHDYCYRLAEGGWRILRLGSPIMAHSMGKIEVKNIFGVSVPIRNYSAIRKYYQARNRVIIARRHKRESVAMACLVVLRWVLEGLIYENDKWAKTGALLRGLSAGLRTDCRFRANT